MSARRVQFSGNRRPTACDHFVPVQRPQEAREVDRERLAVRLGRVGELDAGEHARTEERPRERVRRLADALGHRDRERQERRELRQELDLEPEAREDDLAPREAEDPLVADGVDGVVPARAEQDDRRAATSGNCSSSSRRARASSTVSSASQTGTD